MLHNENKRLAKRCMERSHSGSDRKHGHSHTGSVSAKVKPSRINTFDLSCRENRLSLLITGLCVTVSF